jgi:signal transduction histidine kinase
MQEATFCNTRGPSTLRMFAALFLAVNIFLLDTFLPIEIAAAVLYVLVLVVAHGESVRVPITTLGWSCAALALLSFALTHGLHPGAGAILRLMISLGAIAMTATLLAEHRKALAALRSHDQRYKTIFDTVAVAFWEHDFTGIVKEVQRLRQAGVEDFQGYLAAHPDLVMRLRDMVMVGNPNETALRLLKIPGKQPFYTHLSEFLPEQDESFIDGILAIAERKPRFETETRFIAYDGSSVDVFVNLSFPSQSEGWGSVIGSIMDVTERRRTQDMLERTRAELDEAMRAAAIGELTASITHEVSQPLFAIRAQIDAAVRWLSKAPPDLHEACQALDEVRAAVMQATEVIHRVRRITKPSGRRRDKIDVDILVSDCIQLARRQFPATVFDVERCGGAASVVADGAALRHLIMNLLKNSFQAMNAVAARERWVRVALGADTDTVSVRVIDSGPGFPAEVLVDPFEPTMPISGGRLGIGLAMSRSIVRAHDGSIELTNLVPAGAEVRITFPRG